MKRNQWYLLFVVVLIGGLMLVWFFNQYQIDLTKRVEPPIDIPKSLSKTCALQGCHGLEDVCGNDVAEACTMMYMAGDRCREFIECAIINGDCTTNLTEQFLSCKNCISNCQTQFNDDPEAFFVCESQCGTY